MHLRTVVSCLASTALSAALCAFSTAAELPEDNARRKVNAIPFELQLLPPDIDVVALLSNLLEEGTSPVLGAYGERCRKEMSEILVYRARLCGISESEANALVASQQLLYFSRGLKRSSKGANSIEECVIGYLRSDAPAAKDRKSLQDAIAATFPNIERRDRGIMFSARPDARDREHWPCIYLGKLNSEFEVLCVASSHLLLDAVVKRSTDTWQVARIGRLEAVVRANHDRFNGFLSITTMRTAEEMNDVMLQSWLAPGNVIRQRLYFSRDADSDEDRPTTSGTDIVDAKTYFGISEELSAVARFIDRRTIEAELTATDQKTAHECITSILHSLGLGSSRI